MFKWFVTALLLFLPISTVRSQILKDASTMQLVKKSIDCIYGFKFDEAEKMINEIKSQYPEHPVIILLNGLTDYWKNFPMVPGSVAGETFKKDMFLCIEISEKIISHGNEAEYILSNLSGRGLLLLYFTDNDLYRDVIPLASGTYKYLKQSFNHTFECFDLLYFAGVYNYYRDAYPRIYPIYRSLALLFPPGSSKVGIWQLTKCSEEGYILSNESNYLLFWLMMNYENDSNQSLKYIKKLSEQFPENPLYRIMYIKNLLLNKSYNEAEEIIKNYKPEVPNPYYSACLYVFNGIIQEKKYYDHTKARNYYLTGLNKLEPFGAYANEFNAYAYFGLSRVYNISDEKYKKKEYHKKAMDLVDFKKINFDN